MTTRKPMSLLEYWRARNSPTIFPKGKEEKKETEVNKDKSVFNPVAFFKEGFERGRGYGIGRLIFGIPLFFVFVLGPYLLAFGPFVALIVWALRTLFNGRN